MNNFSPKNFIFIHIGACVVSLLAGSLFLFFLFEVDPTMLFSDFWNTHLILKKNTALLEASSKTHPLAIYFVSILFSLLGFFILGQGKTKVFFQHARIQITLFLILIISSQTISQARYYLGEVDRFYHKTTQEKMSYHFKHSYAFAQYCQRHLSGTRRCRPITDIKVDNQKNMLTYLAVRYYLYPLDIVTHRIHTDFECLIIFLKDHPESSISDSYAAQPFFDSQSLIAIQKDIIQ